MIAMATPSLSRGGGRRRDLVLCLSPDVSSHYNVTQKKKDRDSNGAERRSPSSADNAEDCNEGSGLHEPGRGAEAGPERQLPEPALLRDDRPEGGPRRGHCAGDRGGAG